MKLWLQIWIVVQPALGERQEHGVRRLRLKCDVLTFNGATEVSPSFGPCMPVRTLQALYPDVGLFVSRESIAAAWAVLRLKFTCRVPVLKKYTQ